MTPTHDTAAALWSAIRYAAGDFIRDGDEQAIDRAIAAHVAAEVARRLAPNLELWRWKCHDETIEQAIERLVRERNEYAEKLCERNAALVMAPDVEAAIAQIVACTDLMDNAGSARAREALRAAIAADKARAVEALKSGMRRVFKCSTHEVDPTKAWGCPDCLVELRRARPAPDEARSIGRVAEHLRGLAAEVEPSRMADWFEADRMRLLAHRLRQVAALMPDSDEARRLVEDLGGAQGAWVALLAGNLADSGSIAGSEAVLAARVTAARTALLRALGVEA